MDNLRLFVALDFPREFKAQIKELQENLKQSQADVKWVEEKNYHLTMKFLGDNPVTMIKPINDALARAAEKTKPLELTLTDLGAFPNLKEPKVIWIGLKDKEKSLISLAREIDTRLAALRIPRETKTFRPHLTLGRVRSITGLKSLSEKISKMQNFDFLELAKIKYFSLISSQLTREGPLYTVIHDFKLKD